MKTKAFSFLLLLTNGQDMGGKAKKLLHRNFFNALLLNTARSDRRAYTFYATDQLTTAARIKSYRHLDLSIEEIKAIFKGKNPRKILEEKAKALVNQQKEIDVRLSIIYSF